MIIIYGNNGVGKIIIMNVFIWVFYEKFSVVFIAEI